MSGTEKEIALRAIGRIILNPCLEDDKSRIDIIKMLIDSTLSVEQKELAGLVGNKWEVE